MASCLRSRGKRLGNHLKNLRGVAIMGSVLLTGCSHDGFAPTLPYAVPARFDASKSTRIGQVSRWWTKFRSAELNRLMDEANTDNLDIAVAVAQLEAAEAQAQITGAALFPTLSYADNNSRSRSSGTGSAGRIGSASQRNSLNKQINASYVVDVWGQNRDALEAALHTASASAYQIEVVRLTARASVANNFLIYAGNRERLAVAAENLANAERVLGVLLERKLAGTISDLEVVQQSSLVEIQRANLPLLRQAVEQSRTALALLLGRPVNDLKLTARSVRRLRLPTVSPGLPASLLVRRPDVRNAEEQLAAADANVDVARKAFLPTITLSGLIGYQSANLANLIRPESLIFNAAAGLTQPIFDGGKLRGQLALSEAQRQQLLETYRKSILSALTDVENALIAIREGAAREAAQQKGVEFARQAFVLAEDRLRQGTTDLQTLLTTQNTLFQAEDTLIQVRLARLQAIVSLYQAIGGDWEEAGALAFAQ